MLWGRRGFSLAIYAGDDLVAGAAFDRAFDELFDIWPEQPLRAGLPIAWPIIQLNLPQSPARRRQFDRKYGNVEFARSGGEAHQILAIVNAHLLFPIFRSVRLSKAR